MAESTGNKSRRNFYIILILLLLGLNAWLFYNAYENKEERQKTEQQIAEKDKLYKDLQDIYNQKLTELEQQKGENVKKDSIIGALENDLIGRKTEIENLLQSRNFYNGQSKDVQDKLDEAKRKIFDLEGSTVAYQAKIDSVNASYYKLMGQYKTLQVQFGDEQVHSQQLSNERDSIQNLGSIVAASDVTVSGIHSKSNGKEESESSTKKIDKLKICFNLVPNKLAAGSQQVVYVQITDPSGELLWSAENGSGEFKDMDLGQDTKYTLSTTVDYSGKDLQNYCVYWQQDITFTPGTYNIEIYTNGYRVGNGTFTLKKAFL